MIVDRYDPINLFELVPKLELEMDPELAQLDRLLEDDVLFERVRADLCKRFRTRNRSVRRISQKLHRIALGKGEKAKEQLRDAYRKLISVAKASRTQAVKVGKVLRKQTDPRARRLAQRLEHFVPLLERGIEQAVRRVLCGEQVPATEKILSLFEPHTQIITRRKKIGKPREFGRKILLNEVEGGIISHYEILEDVGREHPHLPESIEAHRKSFGRVPELITGDRGLYSVENEQLAHEAGIKRVALPKSGRTSQERQRYEKQRWFRRGFRFRAAIEGRISVLRRSYGLGRCPKR
jgi:transposase, IS5 family